MAAKSGVANTGPAAHAKRGGRQPGPHYKWIALSNTTLGVLMATINQSIVLIALPDIFRGIGVNPLAPGNTSYLLWMFMGFLVVSAVLVVSFGRLGDMFGRVRMYNIGFAVFTVASIFLAVTWMKGTDAARPAARSSAGVARRVSDRPAILPERHHPPVPQRGRDRFLVRDRRQRNRGHRVAADRPDPAARRRGAGRRGTRRCRG